MLLKRTAKRRDHIIRLHFNSFSRGSCCSMSQSMLIFLCFSTWQQI